MLALAVADEESLGFFFGHWFRVARVSLSLLWLRQTWEVHLLTRLFPGGSWCRLRIRHYYVLPFLETVEERRAVFLNEIAVCTGCQELNDFCKYTTPIIYQATDNFICYIARRRTQHLFKLCCWEALNYNVLLGFFSLELLEEICLVVVRLIIFNLLASGCCTLF